jgi:hypothetical protein
MKHWHRHSIAALGALAAASSVEAQTRPGFQVAVEAFDYRYRERVDGATVVRDDGVFAGLAFSYVETLRDGWFIRVAGQGAAAEVDYRDDEGARIDDVDQGVSRFELGIGRDFPVGAVTLTPSVAVGARVLRDESGGRLASDGARGYDREVGYVYVPLGLAAGVSAGGRARLTVSGRYGWIVGGDVRSGLSEADATLPDLRLDIDGGHMWELDAALTMPLGRRALSIGPFVRRWSADRSESRVVTAPAFAVEFFEPPARTAEAGLRIGFAF